MVMVMSESNLERQACKVFVCPNIKTIEPLCDRLLLELANHSARTTLRYDPEQMKRVSKAIAVAYFKRTYAKPRYASPAPVIASCVYIAGKLTNNWVTQAAVAKHSDYQETTIRKWAKNILLELRDDNLVQLAAS